MRVLITGGAGFLGSHLAEHLKAQGASVFLIDNLATGRLENLSAIPDIKFVNGSVADAALINRSFQEFKPTHVIHSAAAFKDPKNWSEDINTNILGTVNVVQASQRSGVQRFVYFQTALAYGRAKSPIDVDTAYAPQLSYSISKAAGDFYVAMSGLSWVSLRMANIYGARLFTGPQPIFFKKLRAKEACTLVNTRRDFLALEDFLSLMDRVLKVDGAVGAFNVASGEDISIPEVFDMIVEDLGLEPSDFLQPTIQEPAGEDPNSLLLDPSRTIEKFSWAPSITVRTGTRALVEWYKSNGVGETFTHLVKSPTPGAASPR